MDQMIDTTHLSHILAIHPQTWVIDLSYELGICSTEGNGSVLQIQIIQRRSYNDAP